MIFSQERDRLRAYYFDVWRRCRAGEVLSGLDEIIASVIIAHPEYHGMLQKKEDAVLHADFVPEGGVENPFLHLSMHVAIREQTGADRPAGIRRIHARLATQFGSDLAAEHAMLECLGEELWRAQSQGVAPDETRYLEQLRRLLR